MASNLGTVYVELSLDDRVYRQKLSETLTSAQATAKGVETSWRALGVKSDASFEAQRKAAENAFTLIKGSATSTANDIIRAEEAKTAKLKSLNDQQYGHHKSTMDKIKDSMFASFSASQIAVDALYKTIGLVTESFRKGFSAVETYNTSVASMAALVVTFTERQKGASLADQWKDALVYSNAIIPVLEQIAARTLLSGQETTALANAFARSGVFLDATNQKQIEAFTRISNALPLMTQGQEIMKQINSEIRSVMSGSNEATSMMLQTLKAIDPQIEKNLKTWREEGTVLEHVGELLVGFGPATALLENQWQAVKSTLDTTVTQILRGGMAGAYEDIIQKNKDINSFLEEHKGMIAGAITIAWDTVQSIIGAAKGLVVGMLPILKDAGYLVGVIAYGWGGVLAALKPIGEFLGNTIALTYALGKAIVNVANAATMLATGQAEQASVYWNAAKKEYGEVEKLSARNKDILINGIAESVAQYDKKAQAIISSEKKATDASAGAMTARAKVSKAATDKAGKEHADMLAALTKQNKEYYDSSTKSADAWAAKQRSEYAYEYDVITEFYHQRETALDTWYDKQWDIIEKNVADEAKRYEMLTTLNLEYNRKQKTDRTNQLTAFTAFTKKKLDAEYSSYNAIQGFGKQAYEVKLKLLEEESKKIYAATGDQALAYKWLEESKVKAFESYAEKEGKVFDRLKARWTKYARETMDTSRAMYNVIDAGAANLEKQMSANFFNVMKGNMAQVSIDWTSMWDSMLKNASDYLGKLVTEAAMHSVANAANTGLNWLGGLMGITSMSGGTLGETVGNIGGGLWDTVTSFLGLAEGAYTVARDMTVNVHKGEMVIPADQAEAIRKQLEMFSASDSSGVVGFAEGASTFSKGEMGAFGAFTSAFMDSAVNKSANSMIGALLTGGKLGTMASPSNLATTAAWGTLMGAMAAVATNYTMAALADRYGFENTDAGWMSQPASKLGEMYNEAKFESPIANFFKSAAPEIIAAYQWDVQMGRQAGAPGSISSLDVFNAIVEQSAGNMGLGTGNTTFENRSYTGQLGVFGPEVGPGGGGSIGAGEGPGDGGGGELKTGMDYIPRDNFRARLHEGEAVLNKEAAEAWRKGEKQAIGTDGAALPPVVINWNVDGRTLASITYKQTKAGIKMIHSRGVTDI